MGDAGESQYLGSRFQDTFDEFSWRIATPASMGI